MENLCKFYTKQCVCVHDSNVVFVKDGHNNYFKFIMKNAIILVVEDYLKAFIIHVAALFFSV